MTPVIELVTDPARFYAVRQPWQAMWDRAGGSVFQHHDWLSSWVEAMHARGEIKLRVAIAWDGDTMIAALPCAVHRRTGLRVLTWAAQLFSDYCDGIVDPGVHYQLVLQTLWDELFKFGGFDLISFQQVRPDAKFRPFLDGLALRGERLQPADREEKCMRIESRWPNGEAFFRSLNKKGRNNHTRGKRILAELGGEVAFQVIDTVPAGSSALDEIFRLKVDWLRAHDPASPLLGPDLQVLRALLDKALQSGLAEIFVLTCNGGIAAGSVNFVYNEKMEAYFTAYDHAYERASPGTILIVDYTKWSFDRGLHHVDFLRGEEAFKFRMANAETILNSFAGARTVLGHVALRGHRWLARRRARAEPVVAQDDDALDAVGDTARVT